MHPSKPDVQLFIDILARIERDPHHWNQHSWMDFVKVQNGRVDICTSAGCFAGWACLIKGKGQPVLLTSSIDEVVTRGTGGTAVWMKSDGDNVDIDYYAYQLLGIDNIDNTNFTPEQDEAVCDLFDGDNTLPRLYELSAIICGLEEQELIERVRDRAAELAAIDIKTLPRPVTEEGELINASR